MRRSLAPSTFLAPASHRSLSTDGSSASLNRVKSSNPAITRTESSGGVVLKASGGEAASGKDAGRGGMTHSFDAVPRNGERGGSTGSKTCEAEAGKDASRSGMAKSSDVMLEKVERGKGLTTKAYDAVVGKSGERGGSTNLSDLEVKNGVRSGELGSKTFGGEVGMANSMDCGAINNKERVGLFKTIENNSGIARAAAAATSSTPKNDVVHKVSKTPVHPQHIRIIADAETKAERIKELLARKDRSDLKDNVERGDRAFLTSKSQRPSDQTPAVDHMAKRLKQDGQTVDPVKIKPLESVGVNASEPVNNKVLESAEANQTNHITTTSSASTLPRHVIHHFIVYCRPSESQWMESLNLLDGGGDHAAGKNKLDLIDDLNAVCNHPDLRTDGFVPTTINLAKSNKLLLLKELVKSCVGPTMNNKLVIVSDVPGVSLLIQSTLAEIPNISGNVSVTTPVQFENTPMLETMQICILFDTFVSPESLWGLGRKSQSPSTSPPRVYRLLTTALIEERIFLDSLSGFDFLVNPRFEPFSTDALQSSEVVMEMMARERRQKNAPEEQFREMWPVLLIKGWFGEPGTGLVDYFYCKPNYTSKTVKNGSKIKGKKRVDFFPSKTDVVKYVNNMVDSADRVDLVNGLYDLMKWDRHPKLDTVQDSVLKNISCKELITFVLSMAGEEKAAVGSAV